MITCICRNVKFSRHNLVKIINFFEQNKYIQSFMPTLRDLHHCKCPKCGAIDRFSFHCTYERNLSFCINNEIVNFTVTVTRVKCNSCDSTHALLPDFITPYKIMSCESICKIVKEAISSSVLEVSKKLNISYQLIYYYIALLISFFPEIKILNNDKKYLSEFCEEVFILEFDFSNIDFHYDYYHFFRWCFLMDKFRNAPCNSIYIGMAETRST